MTPEALLQAQVDAWNTGDIPGFCALCAEDVVYVNAAGVHRGRAATEAAYLARYPDRAAMGRLSLALASLDVSGDRATALVQWRLEAAAATHGGWALLVLARRGDRWELTHDATFS